MSTARFTATSIPAADAFYFPADSSRQSRLWLPWPEYPTLQRAIAAVAKAVAGFQAVGLLAAPGTARAARDALGSDVDEIMPLATHELRLRDTGPTFLIDGKGGAAAVDWTFNGWGNRGRLDDAGLAHAMLGLAEVRRFRAPLTLESGSFITDGRGTLLALGAAVFDPARNPGLAPLEAFGIFRDWLGVTRVLWLPDAHPDDALVSDVRALAAFVAPGVVAVTDPASSPAASKVAAHLARPRDAQGNRLELVYVPAAPRAAHPQSYTQILPVNGGLLVPAFDVPSDTRAADVGSRDQSQRGDAAAARAPSRTRPRDRTAALGLVAAGDRRRWPAAALHRSRGTGRLRITAPACPQAARRGR